MVKYKLGVEIINMITTNKKTGDWIEYESFTHAQSKAEREGRMKKWWIKQKNKNDRIKPTHINNYTKRKCSKHSCQKIDADIVSQTSKAKSVLT